MVGSCLTKYDKSSYPKVELYYRKYSFASMFYKEMDAGIPITLKSIFFLVVRVQYFFRLQNETPRLQTEKRSQRPTLRPSMDSRFFLRLKTNSRRLTKI